MGVRAGANHGRLMRQPHYRLAGGPTPVVHGFAGLGRFFCGELDTVIDAMKAALREVVRVRGSAFVAADPTASTAVAFINRNEDSITALPVGGTESCQNLVQQGKDLLSGLNSLATGSAIDRIFGSGPGGKGTPIPGVTVADAGGLADTFSKLSGTLKVVAIGGAVIAAAVVVAPIVYQLFGKRR